MYGGTTMKNRKNKTFKIQDNTLKQELTHPKILVDIQVMSNRHLRLGKMKEFTSGKIDVNVI